MVNRKTKWKIIFIAPATSQPRYHKRVVQLLKFCDVEIFAFTRDLYEENTFPPEIPLTLLGKVSPRKYFRRIFKLIPAIFKIRKHLKGKENYLFYALSFDCMLLAKLGGIKHGFYEISDLRQTEGFGKVAPIFEKFMFRDIFGLVLTSRFFYEDFYKKKRFIPTEKVFIIENKVNPILVNKRPNSKNFSQKRIKIGLIGFIMYKKSTELLLNFVQKRPKSYVIECFGDGPLRWLIESYVCENIRYHGSFKNPEELPNIYSQIDLNYVVYDNRFLNVRLLTPNKLYESAYFGVPIVCCAGTSVGKKIVKWNIGKMIRIQNPELFEKDLSSINKNWLQQRSEDCFKLPSTDLLDDGEKIIKTMLKDFIRVNLSIRSNKE